MKIDCICGNVLRDQTDCIPYKAHFIADQDYYELVDKIVKGFEQMWEQIAVDSADAYVSEQFC